MDGCFVIYEYHTDTNISSMIFLKIIPHSHWTPPKDMIQPACCL